MLFSSDKVVVPQQKILLPAILLIGFIVIALTTNVFNVRSLLLSLFQKNIHAVEGLNKKDPSFIANEILIKVKKTAKNKVKENQNNSGISSIDRINKKHKIKKFEKIAKEGEQSKKEQDIFSWYKVTLDTPSAIAKGILNGKSGEIEEPLDEKNKNDHKGKQAIITLQEVAYQLKSDPDIEDISLNYVVTHTATPNDPYYSSSGTWGQAYDDLYGLKKISAASAWDIATGSSSVVVASIDTGVDRNHEDLASNMWTNNDEVPANGVDDDGNGYVDDYYGWDFYSNDNDPMDDHGHGTHTAGTISAVGNNGVGIVGVSWSSKVMALKFLNSNADGTVEKAIQALIYAADNGAKISSNSWGCPCYSTALDDAIKYEYDNGMVPVVAAGNNSTDVLDFAPANADHAIAVAATGSNDQRALFSNWGLKVDVSAPGIDVLSAKAAVSPMCNSNVTVDTSYCRASGTSMAAPHVAGLAALLLSKDPTLANGQVRQLLRIGADPLPIFLGIRDFGFGRINASNSANTTLNPLVPTIAAPTSRAALQGSTSVVGGVTGQNFQSYRVEIAEVTVSSTGTRTYSAWNTLTTSTTQVTNGNLATVDATQLNDKLHTIRLTTTDTSSNNYEFQVYDVVVDNFDVAFTSPAGLIPRSSVEVHGTAIAKVNGLFSHYKLEWGVGSNPSTWSTSGITLANNGSQSVTNGLLGSWDTSSLTDGAEYTLRLTVTGTTGATSSVLTKVTVDKELVQGWPKLYVSEELCNCKYTPVLADIDNNGSKEFVIAIPDGRIDVVNKSGNSLPGFPISLPDANAQINSQVSVDDVDGDGKKELVFGAYTFLDNNAQVPYSTKVYIYRYDGVPYVGWPNPSFTLSPNADVSPTIADLNGGNKEIIFTDHQGRVHALDLQGNELPGFPTEQVSSFVSFPPPPMVADLDNNGQKEIAYGASDKVLLLNAQGALLPGWPITASVSGEVVNMENTPAIGDINGDGQKEIITIGKISNFSPGDGLLYAINKNGVVLPNWPKRVSSALFARAISSPSIVDFTGDGKDEIVLGGSPPVVYNGNGNPQSPLNFLISTGGQAAIGDTDGAISIVSTIDYNEIHISKFQQSLYKWKTVNPTNVGFNGHNSPVLGDIDNNNKKELAFIASRSISSSTSPTGSLQLTEAYLWEFDVISNNSSYEWPMFGHDAQRSGRLPVATPTPTPTATPTPTNTPTPTPTATPTPTPVPDTTPPNVNITSPVNNSTVPRNSNVTITANAADNVGVTKVEFFVGSTLRCTDTVAPYSCVWTVPQQRNVKYQLTARASDAANNQRLSIPVNVTSK